MAAAGSAAGGPAAVFFGSSAMAVAVASATAKKQTAVRENPGIMPPIVDVGLPPRQAFGLLRRNADKLAAKIRPSGFWAPEANSIFNSNIRLFWHVPFAVCTAKQVVIFERVFQNSGIYGIRMLCIAVESSNIKR